MDSKDLKDTKDKAKEIVDSLEQPKPEGHKVDAPKPHTSKKNIFIIIGAVLAVLVVLGLIVLLTQDSDNADQTKKTSSNSTSSTASETTSDYVGQTDKCEPLDGNQWYRSDSTLTLDPVNPQNLGIFIEKRGFFRSTDSGNTWAYKSKGIKGFKARSGTIDNRPCYLEFRSAAIDPTNPKRMMLGALGDFGDINSMFNKAGGLLETLDGGESWHQLLTDNINAYVHDIAIDPSDPKTIYYVTSSQKPQNADKSLMTKGLGYKTTDGGKTWNEMTTGILPNTGGQEIYIDEANPKRLLITTFTFSFGANGRTTSDETLGLLYSEDGGATWTGRKSLPRGDEGIAASFGSPTKFDNLYVSSFTDSGSRSYYTTDGAKTFKKSGLPMDVVAYDPTDVSGSTLIGYAWQSAPAKALYKSTDAGATWKQAGPLPTEITNVQDPKMRISKIVIDPKNNQNVYMAGAGAYLWKSTDGGQTWKATLSLTMLP